MVVWARAISAGRLSPHAPRPGRRPIVRVGSIPPPWAAHRRPTWPSSATSEKPPRPRSAARRHPAHRQRRKASSARRASSSTGAHAEGRARARRRRSISASSPYTPTSWATSWRGTDPDAIVVSENTHRPQRRLPFRLSADEEYVGGNTGNGLGWGVGAATGAKLAAPDRQVVCSIGDGSVMYSASGFWTQARYNIPVLTVVWKSQLPDVRRLSAYNGRMAKSGHYAGMYLGDPDIDFVKLAESQGVRARRSTTPRT